MNRPRPTPRAIVADDLARAAEAHAAALRRGDDPAATLARVVSIRRLALGFAYRLPQGAMHLAAPLVSPTTGRATHRAAANIRPLLLIPRDPAAAVATLSRPQLNEAIRSLTAALAWSAWVGGELDLSEYPRAGGFYHPADLASVALVAGMALSCDRTWARALEYGRLLCRAWRANSRALNAARETAGGKPLPVPHGCQAQLVWIAARTPHAARAAAAK